ncbi:hypothetical protein BX616_004248 [Lobosporangium transversale]|uniref:Pre-mRNA-splicing factor SYF2 n=1 Tax=Lobosporangium transversale TaxID=64571 RepID=A0A1Y2GUH5_9FUNG|nr:SYF2 splicing factor-domain-containing protein [Lobosporangium transversale]KAF9916250.1 hypothetical protein BX616_004248 [Lobosporangium transversale]ORZ21004.1 SYF2 splicing factor-domain-containing protein [Lobosporangium transversale]|eukprot:XP_021882913.1 SYF2 splicing factor-domain-containing protein [Lobosporangium transversale]
MPPKRKAPTKKSKAAAAAAAAAAEAEVAVVKSDTEPAGPVSSETQVADIADAAGTEVSKDSKEVNEEAVTEVKSKKTRKATKVTTVTTTTTITTKTATATEALETLKAPEVPEASEAPETTGTIETTNELVQDKVEEEKKGKGKGKGKAKNEKEVKTSKKSAQSKKALKEEADQDVEMKAADTEEASIEQNQESSVQQQQQQQQEEEAQESADMDVSSELEEKPASTAKESSSLTMAERMAKLKGLRQKLNASKQANRADLMTEHQKSKINKREEAKKERAREEAEKLMAKRDAEEAGEDYERSQFWNYSAESVEKWNEKQEAKRQRMDNKFTDWDQVNHKKYLKQVGELKPNLAAYNAKKEAALHTNEDGELVVASDSGFYRDANSVAFLSDAKPDTLAVDRMAADVAKQIDARTRFSKRRAHKEDEDVNYINDANQRFNQKISRFYDKYTKEIRDDFERGTAL